MITVAGIFTSRAGVERAIERLRALGIPQEHINGLFPGASASELDTVTTTDAEQPGMGKVLGAVVGGVHGAFGGLAGAAVATAVVPGIGPVMVIGLAAAALLGLGGAVAGAAAGGALENTFDIGLPKDELYIYEDALRQGRSVLIVLANDSNQADEIREALTWAGAESLDAAREQWWLGMRDAEAEAYKAEGLEAALQPAAAGKSYADALDFLRMHYIQVYREEAFRRGYARGQAYQEGLREKQQG
jgi:hypothetical protein